MPAEHAVNPLTQLPIIPYLLIFLIFYFLVFKPQKDKQKEQKDRIKNLEKNDKVITLGGIHGIIVALKEKSVTLRVDDNVKIEFERESISTVIKPKS